MNIGFVGLGLIGGSLLKAVKAFTNHTCFFLDVDYETSKKAEEMGLAKNLKNAQNLNICDITFICLHPKQTIDFIETNAKYFKSDSIVCDVCGVKNEIVNTLEPILMAHNVNYIGTHPMAGREFSGFDYSTETLFKNAYFIITKTKNTKKIDILEELSTQCGFKKTVVTTKEEHDKIIAFTSQLAHIVSSSYIKSPTAINESGFSAGSFLDMTRVAYLNEDMWTDLFFMNKDNLIKEIQIIIDNLLNYKNALTDNDKSYMHSLLKNGREIKQTVNKQHKI